MAANNGREDADTSLFDAQGCLVESPLLGVSSDYNTGFLAGGDSLSML